MFGYIDPIANYDHYDYMTLTKISNSRYYYGDPSIPESPFFRKLKQFHRRMQAIYRQKELCILRNIPFPEEHKKDCKNIIRY